VIGLSIFYGQSGEGDVGDYCGGWRVYGVWLRGYESVFGEVGTDVEGWASELIAICKCWDWLTF
jgi:hypothetical protein